MNQKDKNQYADLSTEELTQKRNKQKVILTAFCTIWIVVFLIFGVIILVKGVEKFNLASKLPIFILPITIIPIYVNYAELNKELKSRK